MSVKAVNPLVPSVPRIAVIPAEPIIGKLPLPVSGGPKEPMKIGMAPGKDITMLELGKLHAVEKARTPEGNAWAERLDKTASIPLWMDAAKNYRASTSFFKGWAGTAVLAGTVIATTAATQIEKLVHKRPRPFVADPTLTTIGPRPTDKSYPSGHTSASYAAATVFDALDHNMGVQAYDAARQMAYARVYSGVHYPSDVVAGAKFGTSIAQHMLKWLPGIDPRMDSAPNATAAIQ